MTPRRASELPFLLLKLLLMTGTALVDVTKTCPIMCGVIVKWHDIPRQGDFSLVA